jgi:hypothetical protein
MTLSQLTKEKLPSFHGQIIQKIKGSIYCDQLISPALMYVCETLPSQINCDKEKGFSISL